jgi:hypothetical protein
MRLVRMIQIPIVIAPVITRFEIRGTVFLPPELKNLNGYHNERANPE